MVWFKNEMASDRRKGEVGWPDEPGRNRTKKEGRRVGAKTPDTRPTHGRKTMVVTIFPFARFSSHCPAERLLPGSRSGYYRWRLKRGQEPGATPVRAYPCETAKLRHRPEQRAVAKPLSRFFVSSESRPKQFFALAYLPAATLFWCWLSTLL